VWLFYSRDVILHMCCTIFGFACLLVVSKLVGADNGPAELSGLVLLAVAGLAGITGSLSDALSSGKLPWSS